MYKLRYFLLIFSCLLIFDTYAQWRNVAEQAFYVKRIAEKYHLQPKVLNDSFANLLYNDFLAEIDHNKILFTEPQIVQCNKLVTIIDDDINAQKTTFLETIGPLYKKQLNAILLYLGEVANVPIDKSKDEYYIEWNTYAKNDTELKNRIRLLYKMMVLTKLSTYALKLSPVSRNDETLLKKEEDKIRKKVTQLLTSTYQLQLNPVEGFEAALGNTFCSVMAQVYDPHTNYFTGVAKQSFTSDLSGGKKVVFGFSIGTNEQDELIIADLLPGSSAYKNGQLHINDVVLKFTLPNNQVIDVAELTQQEVSALLSTTNNELTLTVRKQDGKEINVTLQKTEVNSDDGLVQSFLLKNNITLGYIALPDFYVATDEFVNQGCATDVAKEIVKLKKENIQGLILDLRYNGGGSLDQALDLAGIFIDEGALVLTNGTLEKKPLVIRDANRGTIYDGPLIVLVNGYSASASEILVSMLKDYNRAYIVGNTTFGKHIGQVIIPLDTLGDITTILQKKEKPKYGYLKTTVSQYNNLTGTSYQGKGIVPDIQLPLISPIEVSEAALPHYITVGNISKNVTYQALPKKDIGFLQLESKIRVDKDKEWQLAIKAYNTAKTKKDKLPLQWSKLLNYKMADDTLAVGSVDAFTVDNHFYKKERLKVNTTLQKESLSTANYLQKDLILKEVFAIFKSIINSK